MWGCLVFYASKEHDFTLFKGDCRAIVPFVDGKFDMVFADPPYFLSNGGVSIQAGKIVSVNKGKWDASKGYLEDLEFNREWLKVCRDKLTDAGTIWVCGTFHNIFSVASALTELEYRILNAVIWQKTNPPPNLSCRFFTHSAEIIVWARKSNRIPHCYNYDLMHKLAGDRQMTDVWRMPSIAPWEKVCGKHPTQKPLALVARAILASTKEGALVLDPFSGSGTTGIAANLTGRRFVGVEKEHKYLEMAKARRRMLAEKRDEWISKVPDLRNLCAVHKGNLV